MSNVGLPLIQDFLEQFLSPENPGQTGRGNRTLFQGVVKSQDAITKKVTVTVAGGDIKVAPLTSRTYVAGEYVWGVQENAVRILLGVLGKEGGGGGSYSQMIGWGRCDHNSGGTFVGFRAGNGGTGQYTVGVNTGWNWPSNHLVNMPVTAGDLIKIQFHYYAHGLQGEWYWRLMTALNGGGYTATGETRTAPAGTNQSANGEFIYKVPAGTTTLSVSIDVSASQAGTLYRYEPNVGHEYKNSWITAENLGPEQGTTPTSVPTTPNVIWHYVGAAGEPAYANGWASSNGTNALATGHSEGTPRFTKDANGWVTMSGTMINGTIGQHAFILPVGYRPEQRENLATQSAAAYATLIIIGKNNTDTPGRVIPYTGSNGSFSLGNIRFYAGL